MSVDRPVHPFFSIAVAYEEMQPYAEVIKYGTNYIPPAAINLFQEVNHSYNRTAFYSKTADGTIINLPGAFHTFICCRFYQEQMIFFGGTTDGQTRTVSVKAPDGQTVSVLAAPYGDVTFIKPPSTGLERIPLSYFTDRTDRQQPKGLMTPDGLVSAMRNPMLQNYSGQILVDFRPRDNWTVSGNREDKREATVNMIEPTLHGYMRCDEEGLYVDEVASFGTNEIAAMEVANYENNGLFALDGVAPNRRIAVMLAAVKVKLLEPSSMTALDNSYMGYFAGGTARLRGELLHHRNNETYFGAVVQNLANSIMLFNFPADDENTIDGDFSEKWILWQVVKEVNNDVTMRALGGGFGLGLPPNRTPVSGFVYQQNLPDFLWSTNRFRIPIRRQARLGFATLAQYVEGAVPGTAENLITWTVFDAEHVCKDYPIPGTHIAFSCTNEVSWEVKQTDGNWYKQIEPAGAWVLTTVAGTRRWYSTGTTLATPTYVAVRPVLRNTGELNAETIGKLTSVSLGSP